jgi:hypothetical protein
MCLLIARRIPRHPEMIPLIVKLVLHRIRLALACWRFGVTMDEIRRAGRFKELTGRWPDGWK